MTVRPARLADIMRLIDVAREGHAASIYAGAGEIDREYARTMFARSIQKHGHTHHGGMLFLVSADGDDIHGYFLGFLDRVYQIGDKLCATDVHFYMTPRANPRDALTIFNEFLEWSDGNPEVIETLVGKTAIIAEDDGRYEELLKRKGFKVFGQIYRRERIAA